MWYRLSQVEIGRDNENNIVIKVDSNSIQSKSNIIMQLTGVNPSQIDKIVANPVQFQPIEAQVNNTQNQQIVQASKKKFAANDFETDLNKMRKLNETTPKEIEQAKQQYLANAKTLNPTEHSEELNKHWENFGKASRAFPMLPNEVFEPYNSWRPNYADEEIEKYYLEHKGAKALEKEFADSGESDFNAFRKRKIEEKARDIHNAHRDLQSMHTHFGMTSEESNPFAAYNDVRKRWAENVANHYADKVPFSQKDSPRVKLFTGFPGSGKSKFIEPNQTDQSPLRHTDYGLLVDGDEYQPYIPGWQGGAGSSNTLVYAQSIIKPRILKEALERGNDVVIPLVAGNANTVLNEVVNQVIKNLTVDVIVVPTDMNTSHKRSLSRAKQGGRLISPAYNGDPLQASIQAKNIINNPDYINIDDFTKKILSKLGYTPAQMKKLPLEEKQRIHDQYAKLINFEVAQ